MAATMSKATTTQSWNSRAVVRLVEPGSWVRCVQCDDTIKFKARERHQQTICNVYDDGVWQRVEHYHSECYVDAGSPHGDPQD